MKKIQSVIALASVAFLSAACAGANGDHTHQRTTTTSANHSGKMMKDGMKAPAEQKAGVMPAARTDKMTMTQANGDMADGQVKRVNKGSKKITIKHGHIKNLDMPPMTMVFRVADDAMLDKVKKGDKVRFNVEDKDGAMVITEIVPAQ